MADEHSKINEQAGMTKNLKAEEKIVPDILEKVLDKEHLWKSGEYVRSLHDRLGQCVQRNNEDILESVKLLQELCEVSDAMLTSSTNTPRIKHLIRNFETIAATNGADCSLGKQFTDVPEIRSLLLKFKTLNEEDSLRDCLMTFKSAKEKFEKLHSFLASSDGATTEPTRSVSEAKKLSPSNSVITTNSVSPPSLREKIVAFNKALGDGRETSKYFMDCFSSRCSFHDPMTETSVEDMKPPINPWSRTNSGYEGDMESEVEQSDNLDGQAD
ncbi:uncharacterized protein LOC111066571 [Drosophila obscura]|uniref:uncharacterized protein LOC111066571 n=1 Tax=Drosophila obscura TaxID=7282 RepID=UPI000BA0927A|nr:uncharacterized protein LOC111066571 [Drosophila obscura]